MKAGILREKIEIWEPVTTTTSYGDQQTEYQFVREVRANVRYDSGSRTTENDEIFYTVYKTFIVRYYTDVVETMRIKFDNKFYRILSIEPNKYYNDKVIHTELVNE
jgi:head-tail adaptor